jgi:hypothetical protein
MSIFRGASLGTFATISLALLPAIVIPSGNTFASHQTAPRDSHFGDGGVSPFYRWEGAPLRKPGAMLRQEAVSDGFYADHASVAQRILYATTDGRFDGGIVAASGLMYLPIGTPPKGGWPLLVWGHGTTGIADICAPSWEKPLPRDGYFVDSWLQKGYAVIAPDYQGLGTPGTHPYLSRKGEGYSVLDAARSVLFAYRGQISNRVIMAGQSQGSSAVLNATSLAPAYAPEVHVLGTIATGMVLSEPLGPGEVDSLAMMPESPRLNILRIMSAGTKPGSPPPDKLLSEKSKQLAELAQTRCSRALRPIANDLGLTPDNAYAVPAQSLAGMLILPQVPHEALTVPIFVGTGLADLLIAPDRQFRGVKAMCKAGTRLLWRGYAGVTHNGTLTAALSDGQAFAADLLAGRKVDSNCGSIQAPGSLQVPSKDEQLLFND